MVLRVHLEATLLASGALSSLLICPLLLAQATGNKVESSVFPSPLKMEVSERFDPANRSERMAMDRFRFSSGFRDFHVGYSNQAPSMSAGKQFHSLPAGYSLLEFQLKRKWGTIQGFQSTGYNKKSLTPKSARRLAGAGIEIPKSFLGTRLSGFLVHASPASAHTASDPRSVNAQKGSQVVLSLARDAKKGFKLRSELSQSWQPAQPGRKEAGSGRGLYLQLTGDIKKTETNLTYRSQQEGLANPAVPVQGRGRNLLVLDVRRGLKRHQFQYTSQVDAQAGIGSLQVPGLDLRQESLRWAYSPKFLPQISAARMWSLRRTQDREETDENLQVSLNKGLKRVRLGVSWLRGTHISNLSLHPLWELTGLAGDASVEIQKDRRITIRYEQTELLRRNSSQVLSTGNLQLQTRLSCWGDRISFTPALDYRRQEDSQSLLRTSFVNLVVSGLLKLPRYLPGTDLLLTVNSRHLSTAGLPDQGSAGVVIQWNFKRL